MLYKDGSANHTYGLIASYHQCWQLHAPQRLTHFKLHSECWQHHVGSCLQRWKACTAQAVDRAAALSHCGQLLQKASDARFSRKSLVSWLDVVQEIQQARRVAWLRQRCKVR